MKIADGVYWVGAIDWNIRFCGSYGTPLGTTYNAYLIKDEKIALVDTVKEPFFEEMLSRIKELINPEEIDYVIVNHVEKDHAGALPLLLKEAKNAKVIVCERGKESLRKHYEIADVSTVNTGDALSLGSKNLLFIEAAMLHWPDNMLTYVREDALLLSNDPFGQHIATSQRFEDEVGEAVMDRAKHFFASIIQPYSSMVLRKIDELKKIEIKIIAPGHGVVWRNPAKIINAYAEWSQGISKKKAVIAYDTMWGSTDKMARAIAEAMAGEGMEIKLFNLRTTERSEIAKDILDAGAVLVGSPTLNNGMFPTVADFLHYLKGLRPAKNKISAAFGSYGWGGGAVKAINEELNKIGFKVVDSIDIKYMPNEEDIKRCHEFGKKIAEEVKNEQKNS